MVGRRSLLRAGLVGTAWIVLAGHTPYRQWRVYRTRHLLILTSRSDPPSYDLGRQLAEILATHLPTSGARVTRAPDTERIASLISSKQLDVAVLAREDAEALLAGRPPFTDYGPVPLRTIVGLDRYLLVCRTDFPGRHAYLLAKTLSLHHAELSVPLLPAGPGTPANGTVPAHSGALAFFEGRPPPPGDDPRS